MELLNQVLHHLIVHLFNRLVFLLYFFSFHSQKLLARLHLAILFYSGILPLLLFSIGKTEIWHRDIPYPRYLYMEEKAWIDVHSGTFLEIFFFS
jgi:hypothetical protein